MKKSIYKFFKTNEYLFDILISNQLYFSSISQFNDPYDCHLTFPQDIPVEDFKIFLDKWIDSEEIKAKHLKVFENDPTAYLQPFFKSFRELLTHSGICCFSQTKANTLLWSHYADNHKGVSLGFDYELLTKQFPQFEAVNYNNDPFVFDIKDMNGSIAKTILRKSLDWKYEEEVRFLMERSKSVGFDLGTLLEVNFGTRCNRRTMINIYYLINKMGYVNCKFYQARTNDSDYSFSFDPIDFEELKKEVLNESKEKRFKGEISLKHLFDDKQSRP